MHADRRLSRNGSRPGTVYAVGRPQSRLSDAEYAEQGLPFENERWSKNRSPHAGYAIDGDRNASRLLVLRNAAGSK